MLWQPNCYVWGQEVCAQQLLFPPFHFSKCDPHAWADSRIAAGLSLQVPDAFILSTQELLRYWLLEYHPGESNMQGLVPKSNGSVWIMAILLSDVHFSANSNICRSSASKAPCSTHWTLEEIIQGNASGNGMWASRKVQSFLLIMGSQCLLNLWITWSLFSFLKLDIYKTENPQCFSFQEYSGKSLL